MTDNSQNADEGFSRGVLSVKKLADQLMDASQRLHAMEGLGCAVARDFPRKHFLSECERSSATGETNATNGGRMSLR
jgi:hypothetical protein